jgi:hypothetical protein
MNKVKSEGFDRVFVAIDGSDGLSESTISQNLETRSAVTRFVRTNSLGWDLIYPQKRLGIIKNFISSIDQAFLTVDYLIVLEDDCVPASGFLEYFKTVANQTFLDTVKMFTFFRPDSKSIVQGYFFTHNPLMWGWGISKEDWGHIKSGISALAPIKGLAKYKLLPFQGFYYSGYSRAISGESDALDALISYFLLVNDYLVVGPPVNLISNIGYGSLATHTKSRTKFMGSEAFEWTSNVSGMVAKPNIFGVLRNDYSIAREMNNWKFHHIFTSFLKAKLKNFINRIGK